MEAELLRDEGQREHAMMVREQQHVQRRDVDRMQRRQADVQSAVASSTNSKSSRRCEAAAGRRYVGRQPAVEQELEATEAQEVTERIVRTAELDLRTEGIHIERTQVVGV